MMRIDLLFSRAGSMDLAVSQTKNPAGPGSGDFL